LHYASKKKHVETVDCLVKDFEVIADASEKDEVVLTYIHDLEEHVN
jgi:hypothetical protein